MKGFNIILVFFAFFTVSYGQTIEKKADSDKVGYTPFGELITEDRALSDTEMYDRYRQMAVADSVKTKFGGVVLDVCQVKGCWMKLRLKDGNETMVRFKDYGFFVPRDITGKEVIVNGTAFVEEMSIEDQKHYARDGGASEDEVAKIISPRKMFGFEADGVLLKN